MCKKTLHITVLLALLVCMVFTGCDNRKEYKLTGSAMGTVYSVLFVLEKNVSLNDVSRAVEREINGVNQSMSVFDPNSEISRFNAIAAAAGPVTVSDSFYEVMLKAQTINELSEGAWDCTVLPLVNLWGFGPNGAADQIPDKTAIENALAVTGFDKIMLLPDNCLHKQHDDVTIDLASVAKGYAVDRIAVALTELGLKSFLVEIGGEVYTKGVKLDKSKWRVGINTPRRDDALYSIYAIAELSDRAMATSGNYRNFFEKDGQAYSHILDPRTGYPVKNRIVSVSVIAPSCAMADGLATAISVMGVEKGLAIAQNQPDIEVFIIETDNNGEFITHISEGMHSFLVDK